jgi:D-serine deaminase-like pyridoxal phosphate-dependent protein
MRRLDVATRDLDPPFAVVDLDALRANAADLTRRAAGKPIRVASKSVRCRSILHTVLARPGFEGILAYTLAEALWLADEFDDVVIAYPTVERAALRQLAADPQAAARVTLMVDSVEQLNFIDDVVPADRAPLRVCLDLDASLRALGGRLHLGPRRSPVHSPSDAASLAQLVADRPGFRLVGLMAYEGQVAGLADDPVGQRLRAPAIRAMKAASVRELAQRRAAVVAAVEQVTKLEFVNGGGTGSLELTASDPSVTELAAGSGLVGPTLFDAYTRFRPEPALLFALPVVHRPTRNVATLFAGGYVASGTGTPDRLPRPYLPPGLKLLGTEGAGEVQTPVVGRAANQLRLGDRVWLRHAKAGELAERFTDYHVVQGDRVVRTVPTYRGEARSFG